MQYILRLFKTIGANEYIYEVQPIKGTKVKNIFESADDVKVQLHIPIFVVFKQDTRIYIRACSSNVKHNQFIPIIEHIRPNKADPQLKIAMGYDMMGSIVYDNLNKMPHLLITGSTNSGKSVFLMSLILSLTYKFPAQYVNLVIFDIGGRSLSDFDGLPHLSYPIVQDIDECQYVIDKVYNEMERRLDLDENEIKELPYLVCVIDEFLNISEQCTWVFTDTISKILRLGRKVKLHMVLAVQSSTKKSLEIEDNNITARIAFKCAGYHESICAINRAGAEKLTGKGDMLYMPYNSTELEHLQGAFVSDEDRIRMVEEIKNARHFFDNKFIIPEASPLTLSIMKDDSELGSRTDNDPDKELANVILWILGRSEVSVNGLKEKFFMGNRANSIIDKLCKLGVVSEKFAKKPRKVLLNSAEAIPEDVMRLLKNGGISDEDISSAFENRVQN